VRGLASTPCRRDAYRARAAQLIVNQLERDEIANLQRIEGRRVAQIAAMKKDRPSVPQTNKSIRLSDEKPCDCPRRRSAGWGVGASEFAGSTRHVYLAEKTEAGHTPASMPFCITSAVPTGAVARRRQDLRPLTPSDALR